MATYVFSDVHGHHKTLERLLERVAPSDEDDIWILGDMVDRGPDPVAVMQTCKGLANARVLMGNHEDMMLDAIRHPDDSMTRFQWEMNGGNTTAVGLAALPEAELIDLLDWVGNLAFGAHIRVGDRMYLLVHAGIRPLNFSSRSRWTDTTMEALLRYQNTEDVLWIRDEFWGQPTGFLTEDGEGPIVIAGHTPVPYVEDLADRFDRPARNEDGECQIMHLGACEATGGVADRWAIDCGAAGGAGWGRIGMVRLDDGAEFYEAVQEGE
ncbi:MAG: serine/threonine protein phosphatase [Atopobiaceae bacterium]|nr:serine/threonine protein phosphatase [Atopobiaceae bacterium]